MRTAAAVTLAATVVLTGCAAGDNNDVVVETVVVTEGQEPDAGDFFTTVLDNPPTMPEDRASRFHPTGTHSYALVEATGDGTPDLLLRINGEEFSRVLLYTLGDSGEPVASTDYLLDGAAGAGGSRARVLASASGAGVYEISHQSVHPEGTSRLYRLEGGSLRIVDERTVEALSTPPDHVEITWLDIPAPGAPAPEAPAAAEGDSFTGTVVEKSTSEVMNGERPPNGEPESNRYYLLELDAPMDATAQLGGGGGTDTRTITAVSLGRKDRYSDDSAEWLPLVGKRVTVTPHVPQSHWPSDTSLPLGMLGVGASYDVVVH